MVLTCGVAVVLMSGTEQQHLTVWTGLNNFLLLKDPDKPASNVEQALLLDAIANSLQVREYTVLH